MGADFTKVTRPNLIVDGTLDHAATVAELRRCVETVLRKGRFQLSFEVRAVSPAASKEFENPEIVVDFKGRDQQLLLEHNAELLWRLNTSPCAGFGSILNFMAAFASTRAGIAACGSKN